MQKHRRPGLMVWTQAPPSRPLSSSSEEGEDEGEEAGDVLAGLELALGRIGLSDDEIRLGTFSGDAFKDQHCYSPPAEGAADKGSDPGFSPRKLDCDLDASEEEEEPSPTPSEEEEEHSPTPSEEEEEHSPTPSEEEEHSPTPTKCLNKAIHHIQVPEEVSPVLCVTTPTRAPSLPLLISPEELARCPFITDETLPEIHLYSGSSDSSPARPAETRRELRNPQTETRTWKEAGAVSKIPVKVCVTPQRQSFAEATRLSTKARPRSSKSSCRSKASPESEGRRDTAPLFSSGVPCARRLDLSKVEPRVRFPKDGYSPPKSRHSLREGPVSPQPRLVHMSPADILTEVLFSSEAPDPDDELTQAALHMLPPEFRSKEQAISLMNELQEDNYRLKLKCAERANIIDRLRLEAKVNFYSDPPKPGLPLHSGLHVQASRPVTLEIPHPQRAHLSPASPPQTGAQHPLHDIIDKLCTQAQGFLLNVEGFEQSRLSAQPPEQQQVEVFDYFLQKLDTLENEYMSAKKEHVRQQRMGAPADSFDPQRELESLIFQCGLHMDKLKEQIQQRRSQTQALHQPIPAAALEVPLNSVSPSYWSPSVSHDSGFTDGLYQKEHAQESLRCSAAFASPSTDVTHSAAEKRNLRTTLSQCGHDLPDYSELFESHRALHMPLVRELSLQRSPSPAAPVREHAEARRLSMAYPQAPCACREAGHFTPPSSPPLDLPLCLLSSSTSASGRSCDLRALSCGPSREGSMVLQTPSIGGNVMGQSPCIGGNVMGQSPCIGGSMVGQSPGIGGSMVGQSPGIGGSMVGHSPGIGGSVVGQSPCIGGSVVRQCPGIGGSVVGQSPCIGGSVVGQSSCIGGSVVGQSPCVGGSVVGQSPSIGGSVVEQSPSIGGSMVGQSPCIGGSVVGQSPCVGGSVVGQSPSIGGSVVEQSPSIGGSMVGQSPSIGGSMVGQSPCIGGSVVGQSPCVGGSVVGQSPSIGGSVVEQSPSIGGSVVGQSPSSSLSSLKEAPERMDHKPPRDAKMGSQDGLISPGTDSGFVGSEGSRLTPATLTSPVHKREPTGVLAVALSPPASTSRRSREGPAERTKPSRRSRRGEKTRPFSASSSQLHTQRGDKNRSSSASSSQLHTHRGDKTRPSSASHLELHRQKGDQTQSSSVSYSELHTQRGDKTRPSTSSYSELHTQRGDKTRSSSASYSELHTQRGDKTRSSSASYSELHTQRGDKTRPSTSSYSELHTQRGDKTRPCTSSYSELHTQRGGKTRPSTSSYSELHTQRGDKTRPSPVSCSQLHSQRAHRDADGESSASGHYGQNSSTSDEDHSAHSSDSAYSRCGPASCRHGDKSSNADGETQHQEALHSPLFLGDREDPCTSTPLRSERHRTRHRHKGDTRSQKTQTVSNKLSQTDSCFPQRVSRPTQTSAVSTSRPEPEHRPVRKHDSEKTEAAGRECPECSRRASSASPDRAEPCVSVHPHLLLLYPQPPRSHSPAAQSAEESRPRRRREGGGAHREPALADSDVDAELRRALKAARSMNLSSRHMVLTLDSGLRHQRSLTAINSTWS